MREILSNVAGLMALAARTAPKTAGKDFVELKVVDQEDELALLAAAMEKHGQLSGKQNWDRDGANVLHSQAVLLLSLKDARTAGLNCGACGFSRCSDLADLREGPEFSGPLCFWRAVDLGIALGSAVKTASLLNADNRVMYRIGVAARQVGLIAGEVVVGIPLSATGKSIYFDR